MINATLYKELSDASDIVEIQSGVTLAESFPGVDLSRMVIIVNGRESDQSHVVREGDVIILRSIPHALTTAALITLGVIVLGGAVYFGIEAYKARKQAEELEEKLKNLSDSVKNVPYLQGASNSIALGKSQPYLIGEHLFTPYLMTGTFSKLSGTDGTDQYFYAVLENGFNSQVLRRLYCDDVSLKDWGDALTVPQEGIYAFDATSVFYDANSLIEVAQDGAAFATVLFDKKISTESPGAQLKKADDDDYEDLVYTLPRYTRAAEVCIMINGLRAYNDSGSKINRTVTVIPEYQLVDGGAWTAFTFDQNGTPANTFTRNIMTQLRFVARVDFTYAAVASLTDPVKVRLRCTTNAYDGSASDDVYVQWVQSEIYDPIASETASAFVDEKIIGDTERALSTLIGLKIKVTTSNEDKLSKINCVSAGIARTWDGSEWSTAKAPTSNPAAWLLEVLTSPTHLASQCDDSEIDLDSFGELYEYCATNSLAVDMVLADGDTKESIITTILQTCFSMLYRDIYGKISVAIDEAKPNAIALFNTQNVTSFENEKSLGRRADGIKVSYISRDGGYVQSSYLIMRSGVTRSRDSIIRDVSVTGIVEYEHIVKYARRLMAIEALRPKTTTIGVGREGTYFTPLSKVLIQHPSLRVGLGSAEIKSVIDNGTHITGIVLYEPVTYDADDVNGYGVVIGCVGDDYYTPVAAAYTADIDRPTEIEFVTPIILSAAAIPHPGAVLSYGTLVGGLFDLITTPMLISGISPTDEGFALTLVDYDENVYAVGDIPEYVPNFAGLKPTVSVPATVPPADKDTVEEVKEIAVAAAAAAGGRYRGIGILAGLSTGPFTGATVDEDGVVTPGSAVTNISTGDVMVNYSDSGGVSPLGIYKWTGLAWSNSGITSADKAAATVDLLNLSVGGIATPDGTAIITLYVRELFAQQIIVPDGGRIRYETGAGVQKRCVQLADEKIDWLDTPDTTPVSSEQLRFRLGRLGVGGAVLADGELLANIEEQWSAETSIVASVGVYPTLVERKSGQIRRSYVVTPNVYEQVDNGSGYSSANIIFNNANGSAGGLSYFENDSGELYGLYLRYVSGVYTVVVSKFDDDTSSWGDVTEISNPGTNIGHGCFVVKPNGEIAIVYRDTTTLYLSQKTYSSSSWVFDYIISTDTCIFMESVKTKDNVSIIMYLNRTGSDKFCEREMIDSTWSSEVTILNDFVSGISAVKTILDEIFVGYQRNSDNFYVYRIRDNSGTYSAETVLNAASTNGGDFIQLKSGILVLQYRIVGGGLVYRTLQRYARVGAGIVASGGSGAQSDAHWEKKGNGYAEIWGRAWVSTSDANLPNRTCNIVLPINMIANTWTLEATSCSEAVDMAVIAANPSFMSENTGSVYLYHVNGTYVTGYRYINWTAKGRYV